MKIFLFVLGLLTFQVSICQISTTNQPFSSADSITFTDIILYPDSNIRVKKEFAGSNLIRWSRYKRSYKQVEISLVNAPLQLNSFDIYENDLYKEELKIEILRLQEEASNLASNNQYQHLNSRLDYYLKYSIVSKPYKKFYEIFKARLLTGSVVTWYGKDKIRSICNYSEGIEEEKIYFYYKRDKLKKKIIHNKRVKIKTQYFDKKGNIKKEEIHTKNKK